MDNFKLYRNPYIIGRPITEPELFFGRENIINFIDDNLKNKEKIILLHGQRRIGKSTILYQLSQFSNFVQQNEFIFVLFDLQDKAHLSLSGVLHNLAREIIDCLKPFSNSITLPSSLELETDSNIFSGTFLPTVYQAMAGKNLVLLLDEFDVLGSDDPNAASQHFFPYLKTLLKEQQQLFVIAVVGRELDDMKKLLGLFKGAPRKEIGLLDERSATRLITNPAVNVLEYHPDAIRAILELSAGHPYFTQIICFAIVMQARDEQRRQVTRADVENIVEQSIEIGEAGLVWFRDALPIPERVVFSAVAELQQLKVMSFDFGVKEPLTLLEEYGVVQTEKLNQATQRLVEWDFLQRVKSSNQLNDIVPTYKVTIELVRLWLVKQYSLTEVIYQLENLDIQAHQIYIEATEIHQQGKIANAIKLYEQVLQVNPNYFSALFQVAEAYLDVKEFSQAIKFYERAYKVDPVRQKEGLVRARLSYGEYLMMHQQFNLAQQQFNLVIALEPNNKQAKQKLARAGEEIRRALTGPYTIGNFVPAKQFLGRKEEVYIAFTQILNSSNWVFYGGPGIGKTSFLKYLAAPETWQARGMNSDDEYLLVYFNCESIHDFTPSAFWKAVLIELKEVLILLKEKYQSNTPSLSDIEKIVSLQTEIEVVLQEVVLEKDHMKLILQHIKQQDKFLVLLLDNYNAILEQKNNDEHNNDNKVEMLKFLREFRNLAEHEADRQEGLINFIQDNLRQHEKFIILYGQRRIGKSSLIQNIPKFIAPNEFVFVPFDLQYYTKEQLSKVLADLAREIIEHLELNLDKIRPPEIENLEKEPCIFSSKFLTQVYQQLGGKSLVLLIDKFDACNQDDSNSVFEDFFTYLNSIIEEKNHIFTILLFVGRHSADIHIPHILRIFKDAPFREIGLLDEQNATRLIVAPAKGILNYEPEAIKAIWNLSVGHPYFTQVMCSAIFSRARDLEKWTVSSEDVESVVDKAIKLAEAGLIWFWDGLTVPEKVVFSAVVEAQEIAIVNAQGVPQEPLMLLRSYGINQNEKLIQAAKQLVQEGFLDDLGRKVKIEFIRRWLVQRHALRHEIRQLEKLAQPEVIVSNRELYGTLVQGKQQEKLDFKQQDVIWKNPDKKTLKKAISFGNISQYIYQQGLLGTVAVIVIITTIVGLVVYRLSTPCSSSEQKLGIFCVADSSVNISRGDRTLFPTIGNNNRDEAIKAFNKGDYKNAEELFKKAVAANRKDPEVLIYYNNARAKRQSTTIAIAVVVPTDNGESRDKEILRGVAQAQNQFNDIQVNNSKAINSRLLEIVIANDANESEKAKQVAAELAKDPSIMGVIGHGSSETTEVAIPEYEKAGLAIVSPTSTSTLLSGSFFFRAIPSNAAIGKKLAEYAMESLGLNKIVIFYNAQSPYSNNIKEAFEKNFQGQVLRKIDLNKQNFDVLANDKAEAAVFFPSADSLTQALEVMKTPALTSKQKNNRGLKLLGGDSLYLKKTLEEGKDAVEGMVLAVPWFRESSQAKSFAQKAVKQWGGDVSWRTATSFDATQALIKALSLSPNPSRKEVLQRLPNVMLRSDETSGESLQFTSQGERQSEPTLVKIEDGKFKLVR